MYLSLVSLLMLKQCSTGSGPESLLTVSSNMEDKSSLTTLGVTVINIRTGCN